MQMKKEAMNSRRRKKRPNAKEKKKCRRAQQIALAPDGDNNFHFSRDADDDTGPREMHIIYSMRIKSELGALIYLNENCQCRNYEREPLMCTASVAAHAAITQNAWLGKAVSEIEQRYKIVAPKGTYINIVVSCEIDTQKMFLKWGKVMIGFSESSCCEYAKISRCQKLGHLQCNCTFAPKYKRCAGPHACTDDSKRYKCANGMSSTESKR